MGTGICPQHTLYIKGLYLVMDNVQLLFYYSNNVTILTVTAVLQSVFSKTTDLIQWPLGKFLKY